MGKRLSHIRILASTFMIAASTAIYAQCDSTLISKREDGRFTSTYAILHHMLHKTVPAFHYQYGMDKDGYLSWQKGLKNAMAEIMQWPKIETTQPSPRRIKVTKLDGYTREDWECYALDCAVIPFVALIPDGIDTAPGILCLPGSGQTMEELTSKMGKAYVKEGYVAVCVDNAAAGAQSDQEDKYPESWDYDYNLSSRMLLELGWSWLGYTSYLSSKVLDWMRSQPVIRKDRIVISGFSLGTEPMMVLGIMYDDIYAFVYNDFLCQTQERALSMTAINEKGRRSFPNGIRHLIPRYWNFFNFPDVVAALAPRYVILTEGGLDRDFNMVKDAYRTAGCEDKIKCLHYKKYERPEDRDIARISVPEGLTYPQYLPLVNVDSKNHYFKEEHVIPWLREILKR